MSDEYQPTCSDCPHYLGGQMTFGECRVNPPTKDNWPAVSPHDWCSRHPQRLVALNVHIAINTKRHMERMAREESGGVVIPRP
jgi:hypothetical protein